MGEAGWTGLPSAPGGTPIGVRRVQPDPDTKDGAFPVGRRRLTISRLVGLGWRAFKGILKSRLLLVFLLLCALGFWVGMRTRPDPALIPYRELYENLSVLSYRDAPSDSSTRFAVELSACGRVFRQYDLDAHGFVAPESGRDYSRSISGTHYRPLRIRGRAERGFWLEVPEKGGRPLLADQFDELYRRTLGFVKPVSIVTNVLGTLTGYSIGYRIATWSSSLCNPAVQERVVESPGIGRLIAREAWRRVLLEPLVMGDEGDARSFAATHDTQRLYANFFKLALRDSDGFIPREADHLAGAGRATEARTMLAFADAAKRAAADSAELSSADFRAVENWASLLERRGHWALGLAPPPGEGRMVYYGALAWYGLAPAAPGTRRIWVGPRVLVREGDTEGFVADDVLKTEAGCPYVWRDALRTDSDGIGVSAWSAEWTANRPEFAPLVSIGQRVAKQLGVVP